MAQLGQRSRCFRLTATLPACLHKPALAVPFSRVRAISSILNNPLHIRNTKSGFSRRQEVKLPTWLCRAAFTATDIATDVGVMVEGEPKLSETELDALSAALYEDSRLVVQQAAMVLVEGEDRDTPPGPLELSLVLCDDPHIQALNLEWRGKDAPTDVLSFEMGGSFDEDLEEDTTGLYDYEEESGDEEESEEESTKISVESVDKMDESVPGAENEDEEDEEGLDKAPVMLLGDVVISLDTAARQAAERGHSLEDECRILLVHGVLHLLGYDHENGGEEEVEMAEAEVKIMNALGWKGHGLITAQNSSSNKGGDDDTTSTPTTVAASQDSTSPPMPKSSHFTNKRKSSKGDIRLLALDMDGTLLDSRSQVLPSSVDAIRAALAAGVTVMLATGKARPAAIAAMQRVGLAGDGLVVSPNHPGLFLQGLAVHGMDGTLVGGGTLPPEIVRSAFEYSLATKTPICGFLGDHCVTIGGMTPEIELLHTRYYEPLAEVTQSVESVVSGPPLRKLLFMTSAEVVSQQLKPDWEVALKDTGAATMQAVPDMLEIVPRGWNKWVGLQELLRHAALPAEAVMAVGDGGNDFELVGGVGVGIAMGNAVDEVKKVAKAVVATNDEGGIAEAIERFIL